jgi:hypothetical protein
MLGWGWDCSLRIFEWCPRQSVVAGADTLVLISFSPSPRALKPGRRRVHLAIPPVATLSRSATIAQDASVVVCARPGKGAKTDGDDPVH